MKRNLSNLRIGLLLAVALGGVPALGACAPSAAPVTASPPGMARLEPISGAYFGVNLDWDVDSPAAFNQRLGHRAKLFVRFFAFPLADSDLATLATTVKAVASEHGMLLITLEPMGGLAAVTSAAAESLAEGLAQANKSGVPTFVRFAHEMNGSWYPWSQQPSAYIKAFRIVADAVHSRAPQSAMLWAPNYGGGYPFKDGPFEAHPGNGDFSLLDTNGDGRLDMTDDPYGPYYPGDDAVDWVGISLYHWGNAYPWGDNEVPEPGKFLAQLHGKYNGLNGDDSAIPDFYETFWTGHDKPVAIPETAAFYDPKRSGAIELTLKQAWWRQVLDPAFLDAHPGIKMINWFEWFKPETEAGGALIDWRATASPAIAGPFHDDLPVDHLIFGS
ncbi:MAG TPA: glycosyl hydrolase [Anaerolineales bacterium]|nr:glycosyl hydrolase [Anaerolineales bacterium]